MNRVRIRLFKFEMEETEPRWRSLTKLGDFPGNTQGQERGWDSGDADEGAGSGFLSAAALASVMRGACLCLKSLLLPFPKKAGECRPVLADVLPAILTGKRIGEMLLKCKEARLDPLM